MLVEEAKGLQEERRAKEARRARRAAEAFSAMVRHHRAVEAETTWEQAQSLLSGEPEWAEVADDAERKSLFEEAMVRIQARSKERSKRKVRRHLVQLHATRKPALTTEGRERRRERRLRAEKVAEEEKAQKGTKEEAQAVGCGEQGG